MLTYQTGLNFLAFEWKQANLFLRERGNCIKVIWLLKFWQCVNGFVKPLALSVVRIQRVRVYNGL